jgi:hypothetical protein
VAEYRLMTVGDCCLFFRSSLLQYNPQLAPAGTRGLFDGRFAIKLSYINQDMFDHDDDLIHHLSYSLPRLAVYVIYK